MNMSNLEYIGNFHPDELRDSFPHHMQPDTNEQSQLLASHNDKTPSSVASAVPLHSEKNTIKLKNWPSGPTTIKASVFSVIVDAAFDIFLIVSSAAFLVLAIVVKSNDNAFVSDNYIYYGEKEIKPLAKTLLKATKYGPTIFPILFASVVGRLSHTVLCWRLSRGERIGILDTLAASTSLSSTVISQFQMHRLNYIGLCLVAVWALSPIGGQASLRVMSIGPRSLSGSVEPVWYMVPDGNLRAYESENRAGLLDRVNSLFVSVLVQSSVGVDGNERLEDIWDNVKIHRTGGYGTTTSLKADGDGWDDVLPRVSPSAFYSLTGISKEYSSLIKYQGSYDYSRIHSPYLDLSCSKLDAVQANGISDVPDVVEFRGSGASIRYRNSTLMQRTGASLSDLQPFNFLYIPTFTDSSRLDALSCVVQSVYVESEIQCGQRGCSAIRARPSQLEHHPANWTFLDISPSYWPFFLQSFISSIKGQNAGPTFIDQYMANHRFISENTSIGNTTGLSANDYSIRLTQLMNTYYCLLHGLPTSLITATMHPLRLGGFQSTKIPETNQSFIPNQFAESSTAQIIQLWEAKRTFEGTGDSIIVNMPWCVTLGMVSLMLIVASLVTPMIRIFWLSAPDIMMNVSSLAARDARYMNLPDHGGPLDAAERARLLQGVRIRFGDVEPENEVGRLVIGTVGGGAGGHVVGCRKERLYS